MVSAGYNSRQDAHRTRLQQLAAAWGIHPTIPPVSVHVPSPQTRTPNDEFQAEELLKRQRINASQEKNSQSGGIKRAFSSTKKSNTWDPNEIFEALEAHVSNKGTPGVADALIAKLLSAGGDVNVSTMTKRTSLLTRKKSMESLERSRILQKAIQNRQTDMVAVLIQFCDPVTLDQALPLAIHSHDPGLLQMMLARGANLTQKQDSQDAFRQLCIMGGPHNADLVGLIMQSDGRPSPQWVSMSMVDAARKGCLDTVMRLSRATADGDYNKAEALRAAVGQCRVDIALAILTGTKPPTRGGHGVMDSFMKILEHTAISPNVKLALTESLLCAGAAGDAVSIALSQACHAEFYDLVELLVFYGASIEFQNAVVLRNAISTGKTNVVQLLLSKASTLSPLYASECIESIPKTINAEDRHVILSLLLQKGASGVQLHEALIHAVEVRDLQSVQLLVTPNFPGGQLASNHPLANGNAQCGLVYTRHEVASVDYQGGFALAMAVQRGDRPLVEQLLAGRPSRQTMDLVFPRVCALQPEPRYLIAECFLSVGLSPPTVSAALQGAIEERPPRRDEKFISMLLRFNADVNFNDGAGILSAITIRDIPLLTTLLRSRPGPQTVMAAMNKAMMVDDKQARYEIVQMLISAGAGREGPEVSQALIQLLPVQPVDFRLAQLLLEEGQADANFEQGMPVLLAVNDPDPALLELVLQHAKPNPDALTQALQILSDVPTNDAKAAKVEAILRRTRQKNLLNAILVKEVQTILKTSPDKRHLGVVSSLLSAGADVNSHKAAAFCCAVKAADAAIVDLLFTANPNTASLAAALPQSLNILEPMDRLSFTQKLIDAGAPANEANRALVYAINTHHNDLPLIAVLAAHADSSGGEALRAAVKCEHVDIVHTVLDKAPAMYSQEVLQQAFQEAVLLKNRVKRIAICKALLKKGTTGQAVSDALLSAGSDGDVELGRVLMDYGASVEHHDGQAVVEACGAGAPAVVQMLMGTKAEVKMETLTKGFAAAANIGDLSLREQVFKILLQKGVTGDGVDAQLVSASKCGDDGESLVRLLLEHGANVDYNAGESIWNATRSSHMGSLKLMLGIEKVTKHQKTPSKSTLLRSLKASRKLNKDSRYLVTEWLFEAGLPPCDELNIALNKAVKDGPDLRLIELLLKNGASPLANGCETLLDAAQMFSVEVLPLLLSTEIPQKDLSWAFKQAFTPQASSLWLSDKGLQVAKMLLAKGAEGESLTLALVAVIDAYHGEKDEIARKFSAILLQAKLDVSYEDGIVVQKAAQQADSELIRKVLQHNPDTRAVTMAFRYIFDTDLSEEEAVRLITMFTDYYHGEDRLDVVFKHASHEPVVIRALNKFPRSVRILQTLLDAGYYHDEITKLRVMEDMEEDEEVNLLFWALFQPQKRISSGVIELLIDRGANVNFETRLSKTTPLMLAIRSRRHELVKALVLAGSEVEVMDVTGNTPLTMASEMGEVGTSMMPIILAAAPSINDGSLHNAARELNLQALQVLLDFGHDLDFPSTLHGGRSALGELCMNAANSGPLTAAQEKQMEKVMAFLIKEGTDLTIQSDGKSVLLLAMHSAGDPVATTRSLLKVGLWKHVNEPSNQYSDGNYTYSPSQYVARVMRDSDTKPLLLELLKANRTKDVFYANNGPQPEGAVNLPPELLRAERERRAREERIARESEEHAMALARTKELSAHQVEVFKMRAQLEDSRVRQQRQEELSYENEKRAAEDRAFHQELQRRKAEREAAMHHEQRLTEAGLTRARLVSEAELEMENKKQEKMIGWSKQMSSVRIKEREAQEKFDAAADARTMKRITEHKKLVDSQSALAGRLASGGVDQRRQVGYITGELD
ncbi:hypothetical protein QBC35DRAFT_554133 [Podospora australis]|uniref:Ankyrin repeat containing protein n=1 Tax=Podospora australis TaxID=1536484 RepID=A0AAN6WS54_9PEZI|nr:hypothetical protein QBC35DRAFT_554133 [Podospora australis]